MDKYTAFNAASGEHEIFETFDEAQEWLLDIDYDEVSEEHCVGNSYIAEIKWKTKFVVTDKRSDYEVGRLELEEVDRFDS